MGGTCLKAPLAEALAVVCGLACSHASDIQAAACMDDSIEELELASVLNTELDARLEGLGWTREEFAREISKTAAARAVSERPTVV